MGGKGGNLTSHLSRVMCMLKTREEIKKYVKDTILLGDKERISKVLQRYYSVVLKKEEKSGDIVEEAKRIFGV